MTAWWLLIAGAGFAGLAVDAYRLRGGSRDAPYEVVEAKILDQSLDGVPLTEQRERRKSVRRQVGNPDAMVWVWGILAVGCLVAALFAGLA
ncbi:hypothetical protein [Roseateles asaccharophilus]|uniref:Uncharacterized protein n=1 Tax=Roseateles asaccharophilus TaxID=582607 RepID=A0ABU2ADJ9_9BURK|nr:hypothetical protein [Roseateles asaccharophilus]MDR7335281.1 hypothetical protein [Roseateles asaccharophilus]